MVASRPVLLPVCPGCKDEFLGSPAGLQVGTGTLAFQSCSAATFSYNFTEGSSSGMSGLIPLSRIGPVPAGCAY